MKATEIECVDSEAPSTTGSSSDAFTRQYDLLPPIVSIALQKARERGYTAGYESQDRTKAEAEILGYMYSLTGAGS
jgi:hypothetical protein